MKLTLSILKADVGSIGGHTKPSQHMMDAVTDDAADAVKRGLLIDTFVGHTGDDICIIASHTQGPNNTDVHQFAWNSFLHATDIASQYGLYGAGQDLLVDAPSGNIRGAGPAVAEVEFDHEPSKTNRIRPAESFMVLAADKCGPGAYNLPLFLGFADPMYCGGLMLPRLSEGFTFNIIDMDNTDGDSIISLNAPEDYYKLTVLLRDNERFGIDSIVSRYSGQMAAAVSATRMHNIAGTYTGKDDPVAMVRNQGIFPAPEELISPFAKAHYVGGDGRRCLAGVAGDYGIDAKPLVVPQQNSDLVVIFGRVESYYAIAVRVIHIYDVESEALRKPGQHQPATVHRVGES